MKNARILGNYVQTLAIANNISNADLADKLGCDEITLSKFFKGFVYPSFSQICQLSELLAISIPDLLNGNAESYKNTVVHCMNDFDNDSNRETILDIIESYVDIYDSVHKK